jgi:methionyl-tRNA synthetase
VNKYVDENEPWKLIKAEEDREDAQAVLYTIAEGLRISALMLYSFFPEKM